MQWTSLNDLREKYGINLEAYIDQMDSEYEQISFIGAQMQIMNHFDRHAA